MKKALSACVAVTSVTLLDSPDDQIAAIEQAFASLDPILARYDEISMADADGKRIKVRDNRCCVHPHPICIKRAAERDRDAQVQLCGC